MKPNEMTSLSQGRGFARRMSIYLREMYPVLPRLATAGLMYLGFGFMVCRTQGWPVPVPSLASCAAVLSLFLLMLILRLMDELKDKDVDALLFPDRPLPSGKVRESDIWIALGCTISSYLLLNTFERSVAITSAVVFGYTLLMFRFFFIPNILKKSVVLTLVTHNPIILLMLLQLIVFMSWEGNQDIAAIEWLPLAPLVAQYWLMFFAWEISRKIRSAEAENAYRTYSRIFGIRGAVALAAGAQTLSFAIGVYFFVAHSFGPAYILLLLAGYGLLMLGYAQFLENPGREGSRPRKESEFYVFCVLAADVFERLISIF